LMYTEQITNYESKIRQYETEMNRYTLEIKNLKMGVGVDQSVYSSVTNEITTKYETRITEITKEITTKYETRITEITKRYEEQLAELRLQINTQMTQINQTTNIRENVTIEINKKYDVVIKSLKEEYEKKILNLTIANEDLIKKYKQMEATYNKRITDLLREQQDNEVVESCAPSETMYIWKDSNLETEKEEKIKYVDKEKPVPVKPKIVEVERLVTNVV